MTPHIEAKKDQIANVVIMPGDPLRAKWIAENFLSKISLVNKVRGMLAYTGIYRNKKITIMGHGMGIPSIGIYSYELFKFYDVDFIIRVGSCGSYKSEINVGDIIITKATFSYSDYPKDIGLKNAKSTYETDERILNDAIKTADDLKFKYHLSKVYSEDTFYNHYSLEENIKRSQNCDVVEMETAGLYANAIVLNKKAITLLTCSDSFITKESMSSLQRQESFDKMIRLALELGYKYAKQYSK